MSLLMQKTKNEKEILRLNNKVQKLESLCRALQVERNRGGSSEKDEATKGSVINVVEFVEGNFYSQMQLKRKRQPHNLPPTPHPQKRRPTPRINRRRGRVRNRRLRKSRKKLRAQKPLLLRRRRRRRHPLVLLPSPRMMVTNDFSVRPMLKTCSDCMKPLQSFLASTLDPSPSHAVAPRGLLV
jgi:hypothetical protein